MEQVETQPNEKDLIYRHALRPEWGLAVLVDSEDDKSTFQFEDGKVRVFKRAYLHHMQTVDAPADETARTLARLGASEAKKPANETGKTEAALPLDAQIMLFQSLYPEGFSDEKWQNTRRGSADQRRLKRHRQAALDEASEFLAEKPLAEAIAQGRHAEVMTRLAALLEATDLVTKAQVAPLCIAAEEGKRAADFVSMLYALLYTSEDPLSIRFERWVTELEMSCGGTPSWTLATAPLALARPDEHVPVRPASFARQAAWMAPQLAKEREVKGRSYERWLDMTRRVVEALRGADLAPQDNLDVYDFMLETLTPKRMDQARELYASRA
jgi:hypothetical protein